MRLQIAVGGVLLFVAMYMFLGVMVATWLGHRGHTLSVDSVIPEPLSGPEGSPAVLDNLRLWVGIAVVLIVIAYTLPLLGLVGDGLLQPGAPPVGV
jgi:cytochrome c oxidase subunit 1